MNSSRQEISLSIAEYRIEESHMEQTITVFGILLHPNTAQLLLVKTEDGWTLPHFTRERWELWSCVSDVNDVMRRQLGFTPITLRCHAIDMIGDATHVLYGIENSDPEWSPSSECRWASCDEILAEALLPPHITAWVTDWFKWEACREACRVSWYERGWSQPALAWIEQQMQQLGLQITGTPHQLRTCQRSTLWEIPTIEGRCFFKAVPSFFGYEISLTEYLATVFPNAIPGVLASNIGAGWMLLSDAGDNFFSQSADLDTWSATLHRYAEMQVELIRHVDRLIALGCPILPPGELGSGLQEILANPQVLTSVDAEFIVTANEMELLRERCQQVAALGQKLAGSPIPLSLNHGDLWTGQILTRNGRPTFIDWSDANISIPFIDLFKYLMPQEVETTFPDNPDAERTLRDAYLDPWKAFASHDQLVELFHQAQAIAPLHYALHNYRLLHPRMEVRWENGNMIPLFVKRFAGRIGDRRISNQT